MNGQDRAAGTHHQTGGGEDRQHPAPDLPEGDHGQELDGGAGIHGLGDEGIDAPLEEKGQQRPDKPQKHPFHHKGGTDKAVGPAG